MCTCQQPQKVYLALGSNLGDRLALLEQACDLLSELFGDLELSQVYETAPQNCPADSPPYLNACVAISTSMPADQLLEQCLRIEQKLGRERSGIYGEARPCDIDIITYGEQIHQTSKLTLPHPRAHLRSFVLQPLSDIDPLLILPGQRTSVSELLSQLNEPSESQPRAFDL